VTAPGGKGQRARDTRLRTEASLAFSTTEKRIGVGIIGLSAKEGWAAAPHVPALRAVEGYELRALSASSAAAAGEAHDVPLTFGTAEESATPWLAQSRRTYAQELLAAAGSALHADGATTRLASPHRQAVRTHA
jgi:hypothetical protein